MENALGLESKRRGREKKRERLRSLCVRREEKRKGVRERTLRDPLAKVEGRCQYCVDSLHVPVQAGSGGGKSVQREEI